MKILNYNDYFRKSLNDIYLELKQENSFRHLNEFLYKLQGESSFNDYIIGLLYESSFVVCSLSLKYLPDDKQLQNNIKFLKKFSNIKELKENLTLGTLLSFLEDTSFFYNSDFNFKKKSLENSLKDKEYIINIFPSFLNDLLFCFNKYNISEIMDEYIKNVSMEDKNAFNKTVNISVNNLIDLESKDFSDFKCMILEIMESYYIYKKYLLSNNFLFDDSDIKLISMIENDLLSTVFSSVNNKEILSKLVSGYLEFKLLSKDKLIKVKEYYNDKNARKDIQKIIKKSYKLRNSST